MGKPVIEFQAREGYALWAATYDRDPNPLLALEQRVAARLLGKLAGLRVIDVCAGTGRWMSIARSMGANVIGIDLSEQMLQRAAEKPDLAGRIAGGDVSRLPFHDRAADLAICSFGMSYVTCCAAAFRELARVAQRVMVSDMHPAAKQAGWTRSFETASATCRLTHHTHSFETLEAAARDAGLSSESSVEARFGEPERSIFAHARKEHLFASVSHIPAIFVKTWRHAC
ncbi:MAG TPA: methyltransferase domain-containing protein [Bryobacteraceae bacterium]|nr:methyltransferase domain-containing protein [Bryobacteraceae bacterium]